MGVCCVVHGGAWNIPNELVQDHLLGMKQAIELAKTELEAGKDAIQVATLVIKLLEDIPCFDAGKGSFLTRFDSNPPV